MAQAVAQLAWWYPMLEVLHIVGIALLLGNLVLLEARVFGLGATLDVAALARLSLALALAGFGLAALTGTLMFMTQPAELLANRGVVWKMLGLFVAGSNAAVFHARRSLERLDAIARTQMVLSTLLWLAIVACGRWIAYV